MIKEEENLHMAIKKIGYEHGFLRGKPIYGLKENICVIVKEITPLSKSYSGTDFRSANVSDGSKDVIMSFRKHWKDMKVVEAGDIVLVREGMIRNNIREDIVELDVRNDLNLQRYSPYDSEHSKVLESLRKRAKAYNHSILPTKTESSHPMLELGIEDIHKEEVVHGLTKEEHEELLAKEIKEQEYKDEEKYQEEHEKEQKEIIGEQTKEEII